jgi:predicted anti-sigma-YlaC factor YlaD
MNCEQATRLMSDAEDRPLTLSEKAALRLHLMMCVGCRRFSSQVGVLRQAMQQWTMAAPAADPAEDGDGAGRRSSSDGPSDPPAKG